MQVSLPMPVTRLRAICAQRRGKKSREAIRVRREVPAPAVAVQRAELRREIFLFLRRQNGMIFPVRTSAVFPPATLPYRLLRPEWHGPGVHTAPGNAGAGEKAEPGFCREASFNLFSSESGQSAIVATPALVTLVTIPPQLLMLETQDRFKRWR